LFAQTALHKTLAAPDDLAYLAPFDGKLGGRKVFVIELQPLRSIDCRPWFAMPQKLLRKSHALVLQVALLVKNLEGNFIRLGNGNVISKKQR
jgi:hypothetical protein